MSSIKIILYFKNAKYADALARGLCYECTGLDVFFAQNEEMITSLIDRGILLTDRSLKFEGKTIFFYDKNQIKGEYSISKISSLREIVYKIKNLAYKTYGAKLYLKDYNTQVIEVYSRKGGNGVTSFAITLSRIISMETDSRVLYLNFSIMDDYDEVLDTEHNKKALSKQHFIILKDEGINPNIEDYLKMDSWNVHYFEPERDYNTFFKRSDRVLNYILEEGFASYVIIDKGKSISNKEAIKEIELLENSLVYREKDLLNEFPLINDQDSFIKIGGKIEISMRGKYANNINMFVKNSEILC